MATVGIHPPKTPVTKGSRTLAKATLPNVCKMPGPPAPFVPAPLPNIGKSELSPKGYSTTVNIEGNAVAIRGASFESMGDIASKGTGGGLISANTHGPVKFITPGSFTVKIEGKSVHLLGEPVLNNCGPSGSPPNTGATLTGVDHSDIDEPPSVDHVLKCIACKCDAEVNANQPNLSCMRSGTEKHDCCEREIQSHRASGNPPAIDGEHGYNPGPPLTGVVGSRAENFAAGTLPSGSCWPDAAALDANGDVQQFFDFKFKCQTAKYAGGPTWSRRRGVSQETRYDDLNQDLNPNSDPPQIVDNQGCPPPDPCS
jgi:hypothetical protein